MLLIQFCCLVVEFGVCFILGKKLEIEKVVIIYLKKLTRRCGSSNRVPPLQAQSLEFRPQSHQKNKNKSETLTICS
jgi:hypothetical protein